MPRRPPSGPGFFEKLTAEREKHARDAATFERGLREGRPAGWGQPLPPIEHESKNPMWSLPPRPDDAGDTGAQLLWAIAVAEVNVREAKPGTQPATTALKALIELQTQYAAFQKVASMPAEIEPGDARAELMDLAARLPLPLLEPFALRYLAAHEALIHPEYVERVKLAAAGLAPPEATPAPGGWAPGIGDAEDFDDDGEPLEEAQ